MGWWGKGRGAEIKDMLVITAALCTEGFLCVPFCAKGSVGSFLVIFTMTLQSMELRRRLGSQ